MPDLTAILPAAVAVAQSRVNTGVYVAVGVDSTMEPAVPELHPQERAIIGTAVPQRRREFAVGRSCARRAIARLGGPPVAIAKGSAGEPLWPDGVVGSITHCAGFVAAAVARRAQVGTVGIDAEPNEPLPDGVLDLTASPAEKERLALLADLDPAVHWGRLSFCAKEAVFKAWFPVQRSWLDFADVDVRLDRSGSFRALLLDSAPSHHPRFDDCTGRWALDDGILLAAVTLPAWSERTDVPPDRSDAGPS